MVRRATANDVDVLAKTLGAAFADYPWTTWTVDPQDHLARVQSLQRIYLAELAIPFGEVWTTADFDAVAAFLPPNVPDLRDKTLEQLGELHGAYASRLSDIKLPSSPDAEAWTLATVGVRPGQQGTGKGSKVLRAGLGSIDARGASVHLETSDPRNVQLYQRLGFAIHATTIIPMNGPTVWSMFRPAGRQ